MCRLLATEGWFLEPSTVVPSASRANGSGQAPPRLWQTEAGTSCTAQAGWVPGTNRPLPRPGNRQVRRECSHFDSPTSSRPSSRSPSAMTETAGVDAILLLLEGPADWQRLRNMAGSGKVKLLVAADTAEQLAGAKEAGPGGDPPRHAR